MRLHLPRIVRTMLALALLAVPALAGDPKPAPKPAVAGAPQADLRIALMDGSLLAGKLSVAELSIDTKFGTLKVPVDQIRSFSPGLESHPVFEQKLAGLMNDLGSEAFADREKAQETLLKMGPDIKNEMERQIKGVPDGEKQSRMTKIIEDFESQKPEESPEYTPWQRHDVIVTPEFTIAGHITTTNFSLVATYGKLDLTLQDIRTARRPLDREEDVRKTITVSGNDMTNRTYENSGVRVSKGDQIFVTASGNIQMTPWGNGNVSTPDGGIGGRWGVMQPGNIPTGALIAKIGDNGTPIKVGVKATITADHDGILQFSIALQDGMNGNQFPGEYEVKVRVVKK